ncbi:hypothetical protein GCM10025791_30730 [Halioxenophilus aromaticivorans]|uniref:Uncharacterized protein n=1 Tax=Halioxenophilus aromaticivorans TaxID=1306992 RepID=A0AAV3U5H5_9ALTE
MQAFINDMFEPVMLNASKLIVQTGNAMSRRNPRVDRVSGIVMFIAVVNAGSFSGDAFSRCQGDC